MEKYNKETVKMRVRTLTEWIECFNKIQHAYDKLKELFGVEPDSLIVAAMFDPFERYTACLTKSLDDENDFLNWFLWDNDAGKNGMLAKAASWKTCRSIKTVEDLEKLIRKEE
jgi:hypothetical protein